MAQAMQVGSTHCGEWKALQPRSVPRHVEHGRTKAEDGLTMGMRSLGMSRMDGNICPVSLPTPKGIIMECIKTGADVIVSPYRIHGDLFRDDKRGLYVLNATGCHSGAQYVDGILAVANISFGRNWDRVGQIYFCSIKDADSEFFYYPVEIQV